MWNGAGDTGNQGPTIGSSNPVVYCLNIEGSGPGLEPGMLAAKVEIPRSFPTLRCKHIAFPQSCQPLEHPGCDGDRQQGDLLCDD